MRKVLTVLGARPQFVKAATVSRVIEREGNLAEVLVHTGQHHDANMSAIFFDELEIRRPDYHLGIAGGMHGAMTGRMLGAVEEVVISEAPDLLLVYGDTNSTLAGALAAAKLNVPVGHVEAGLRSFNRRMPEEINRVLTDHLSAWLMSPTEAATANLKSEGISEERIFQVGDVMYDAAMFYGPKAERCSRVLEDHGLRRGEYVLATIHRQENTDDPKRLAAIFESLRRVGEELRVVLPLHPRTRNQIEALGAAALTEGLIVLSPVGYLDMIMLERGAAVIATDSGGVQKEAYFYGVPCVTLRDETEWVELVSLNWNRVVSPGSGDLVAAILGAVGTRGDVGEPYGNGHAAERVVALLN